jgi:hypothetical protein
MFKPLADPDSGFYFAFLVDLQESIIAPVLA